MTTSLTRQNKLFKVLGLRSKQKSSSRCETFCYFFNGGVYWTKFETISGKIRRILTNDNCASHARSARNPKTKNFLTIPLSTGVWGERAKNGKENFWFWFRRFIPPERTCIYILVLWRYFVRPFLRHLRRCEALPPYPRFVVVLMSAHTSHHLA